MSGLRDGEIEVNGLTIKDFSDIVLVDIDPGVEEVETSDLPNPVFDVVYPGRDFYRPPTWVFTFAVFGDTPAKALENLSRLKKAWRDPIGKRGGDSSELKYWFAGRHRVIYGRCRRFSHTINNYKRGEIIVTAEFRMTDPIHYEQGWKTLEVPMSWQIYYAYSAGSSLEWRNTYRKKEINPVGGDAPVPFLVDIIGPVRDPGVFIGDHRYTFNLTVPAGESMRIDTLRGHAMLGGANVLDKMTNRTRLRGVRLPNGAVEVGLAGQPVVGQGDTGKAIFWWRPAWYGM